MAVYPKQGSSPWVTTWWLCDIEQVHHLLIVIIFYQKIESKLKYIYCRNGKKWYLPHRVFWKSNEIILLLQCITYNRITLNRGHFLHITYFFLKYNMKMLRYYQVWLMYFLWRFWVLIQSLFGRLCHDSFSSWAKL